MIRRLASAAVLFLAARILHSPSALGAVGSRGHRVSATLRRAKGFGAAAPAKKRPAVKSKEEQYSTKRGKQLIDEAVKLYDRAQALTVSEDHERALPLYRKARVAFGKASGKGSQDYAKVCRCLAATFAQVGDTGNATKFFNEAKGAFALSVGEKNPAYAACLHDLARVKLSTRDGDPREAEDFLQRALTIYMQDLEYWHVEYIEVLQSLGSLYESMGSTDDVQRLKLEIQRVEAIAARKR